MKEQGPQLQGPQVSRPAVGACPGQVLPGYKYSGWDLTIPPPGERVQGKLPPLWGLRPYKSIAY